MKVRLEGLILENEWAVASLEKVCEVRSRSKLYPNRDNKGCRCYVEIFPNGGGQPGLMMWCWEVATSPWVNLPPWQKNPGASAGASAAWKRSRGVSSSGAVQA